MESTVATLNSVPIGFRFRPTDEELVDHYLKRKLLHDDVPLLPVFDLRKVEPWDVPAMSEIKSDQEWFFFSPVYYKYSNSKRVDRKTKCGFWKPTGNERYIKTRGTNNVIGAKKTLVFYEGHVPDGSSKSNWVIHEYNVKNFQESQRTFVLCRLMKKAETKSKGEIDGLTSDEGEPSGHITSDIENQSTAAKPGIDVLVFGEGQPSRYMASDDENQATAEGISYVGTLLEMDMETMFQAEYLPPIPEFPISIDQETNSTFNDAYFKNEENIMQTPFEIMQTPLEIMQTLSEINEVEINEVFLNSIIADEIQMHGNDVDPSTV